MKQAISDQFVTINSTDGLPSGKFYQVTYKIENGNLAYVQKVELKDESERWKKE